MHDKPEGPAALTRDDSTASPADSDLGAMISEVDVGALISELETADPAAAPDIADAIAAQLESGLGPTDDVDTAQPS